MFKTALTSLLLFMALCFGAKAAMPENRALGDFAAVQHYVDQNPQANQLASLESFGFFQKHASECCNATNRGRIPTPDRRTELAELFDRGNPRSGIQIGNRTVLGDPTNRGGARVFDGVTDAEVRDYFMQLTGQPLPKNPTTAIPGRGNIYTVETPDGNFSLRDFSTYGVGRWTIDVPASVVGQPGRRPLELKFR